MTAFHHANGPPGAAADVAGEVDSWLADGVNNDDTTTSLGWFSPRWFWRGSGVVMGALLVFLLAWAIQLAPTSGDGTASGAGGAAAAASSADGDGVAGLPCKREVSVVPAALTLQMLPANLDALDASGDGTVSRAELSQGFTLLGQDPTPVELDALYDELVASGSSQRHGNQTAANATAWTIARPTGTTTGSTAPPAAATAVAGAGNTAAPSTTVAAAGAGAGASAPDGCMAEPLSFIGDGWCDAYVMKEVFNKRIMARCLTKGQCRSRRLRSVRRAYDNPPRGVRAANPEESRQSNPLELGCVALFLCRHSPYNTPRCGYDGGDCCDPKAPFMDCKDPASPGFGNSSAKGRFPAPRNPRCVPPTLFFLTSLAVLFLLSPCFPCWQTLPPPQARALLDLDIRSKRVPVYALERLPGHLALPCNPDTVCTICLVDQVHDPRG